MKVLLEKGSPLCCTGGPPKELCFHQQSKKISERLLTLVLAEILLN